MDATTEQTDATGRKTPRAAGEVEEISCGGRRAWVFQRVKGGSFYVKGNLPGGAQFYRSTGFKTKGMGLDTARKLWKAALEGRTEDLEKAKLRKIQEKAGATLGEIVRAHGLAHAAGRLAIDGETVKNYHWALRRLVGWATGQQAKVGLRRKIDEAGVMALPATVLTEGLIDEAVRLYLAEAGADRLVRDRRLRTVNSMIGNARAMFETVAMKAYAGLVLPDLTGFLGAPLRKEAALEHVMLGDDAVRRMALAALELRDGKWLMANGKALYLVHLLFRHFGMRNEEIAEARAEWIERLAVPRRVFLASGEAREIVAVMKISRRSYFTPKASAGEVGISSEVLAEIEPYLQIANGKGQMADGTSPHLVPAETVTERRALVYRDHSRFMKPFLGAQFQKTSYELRRWGATVVARLHQSEEMAARFLRHAPKRGTATAVRHYLTERPLPAPITLSDCGL